MRKKKGEDIPPVELTIAMIINVNITDSISFEFTFLDIKKFFVK